MEQENKKSKTLLVVRHAKSDWETGALNDFERPLNARGIKDAPEMAKRLKEKNLRIDAFVSSPAKRAKKTAELFAEAYDKKEDDVIFLSKLYHATPETFYEAVNELDNSFQTVAIFSHNNGLTEFVNMLIEDVQVGNVPTCGVFAVSIHSDKWSDFEKSKKEFLFFDFPKNG